MSIYFFELPRVMRLTKNFESPVAGWCGIFRNITNFVTLRNGDYGHFQRVVEAMTIRSLSEQEIKEYFSDMMTLEDMEPYIEGGHELGYRKGLAEGLEKGEKEKVAFIKGLHKAGVSAEVIASAARQSVDDIPIPVTIKKPLGTENIFCYPKGLIFFLRMITQPPKKKASTIPK